VHEVIAAIATMPWSTSKDVPSARVTATGVRGRPLPAPTGCRGAPLVSFGVLVARGGGRGITGRERVRRCRIDLTGIERCVVDVSRRLVRNAGLASVNGIRSCGRLRAGDRGHDGAQVQLEVLGEIGLRVGVQPQTLLLGVGLDQGDLVGRTPRQFQVL